MSASAENKWDGVPLRAIPDQEERKAEYRRRLALQESKEPPRALSLGEKDAYRGKWERRRVRDDETFRERAYDREKGVLAKVRAEKEVGES
jgi:hypothetical protein